VKIRIEGHDLPGRRFDEADVDRDNVHVAVQVGREPHGLVPGDAASATWTIDVRTVATPDGLDLRGPAVHGRRGERFLYLTWGQVGTDGTFEMFRRAKLMVADIDARLLEDAAAPDAPGITASVELRDARGGPRCARVRPPAIEWRRTAS
jgi:hypothetical protein